MFSISAQPHIKNWAEQDLKSDAVLGGWNQKSGITAHYLHDDKLASTVVEDKTSNSFNGVLLGGDNTSHLSVTGLVLNSMHSWEDTS